MTPGNQQQNFLDFMNDFGNYYFEMFDRKDPVGGVFGSDGCEFIYGMFTAGVTVIDCLALRYGMVKDQTRKPRYLNNRTYLLHVAHHIHLTFQKISRLLSKYEVVGKVIDYLQGVRVIDRLADYSTFVVSSGSTPAAFNQGSQNALSEYTLALIAFS